MTFYILIFVTIAAVFGSVFGFPNGGVQSSDLTTVPVGECPYDSIEGTSITPFQILNSRQNYCINPSPAVKGQMFNHSKTLDEYRNFFQIQCAKVPTARQCIANVTALSGVCLREINNRMLIANRQFIEAGFDVICQQGGERAAIFYGVEAKYLRGKNITRLRSCMHEWFNEAFVVKPFDSQASFTLQRYRAFKLAKACFVDIAQGQTSNISTVVTLINELLSKITCITRETGSIVSCEEIDDDSNSI